MINKDLAEFIQKDIKRKGVQLDGLFFHLSGLVGPVKDFLLEVKKDEPQKHSEVMRSVISFLLLSTTDNLDEALGILKSINDNISYYDKGVNHG